MGSGDVVEAGAVMGGSGGRGEDEGELPSGEAEGPVGELLVMNGKMMVKVIYGVDPIRLGLEFSKKIRV